MASQSGQSGQAGMTQHAPYPPQTWSIGGAPVKKIDVPVTSVFLLLFIISAVTHMTIFQTNRRRGHKFILSGLLFGFSMARIVSCIMRIASVCLPTDIPLSIAAQVFLQAGVVIIFIVNLVFTQRILRAVHRNSAWHPIISTLYIALYVLIIFTIAMVIVVAVQASYTLNANTHRIDRDIQLYGTTLFAFVSFLPIPMIFLGYILPRSAPLDKFGSGHHRVKVTILLVATVLVCFGASYRAGMLWRTPIPRTAPLPKVMGKGPFYIAYFTVEIAVLYMYAIFRVDQRFHVPDGAKGPGSYSGKREEPGKLESPAMGGGVFSDTETFDEEDRKSQHDVEKGHKKSSSVDRTVMQQYQHLQPPPSTHAVDRNQNLPETSL